MRLGNIIPGAARLFVCLLLVLLVLFLVLFFFCFENLVLVKIQPASLAGFSLPLPPRRWVL